MDLGRFAIRTVVACVALVAFVTASSLGLFNNDALRHQYVGPLFPEGWELFTRDPQTPLFHVAVKRRGDWVTADRGPLSKPSNVFGFNRRARWQAVEIERLVAEVPQLVDWERCTRAPLGCLARAEREQTHTVPNRTPYQSLCGRVGLVRQLIVPWDDARGGSDLQTTHVVALEVEC